MKAFSMVRQPLFESPCQWDPGDQRTGDCGSAVSGAGEDAGNQREGTIGDRQIKRMILGIGGKNMSKAAVLEVL